MDAVADIAEKAGSALIFVRHWRKAGGSAMHKKEPGLVDIGADRWFGCDVCPR